MSQLSVSKVIERPFIFELNEFFSKDSWPLKEHPKYWAILFGKNSNQTSLNFKMISNDYIKNEIKGYLAYSIEQKELQPKTVLSKYKSLQHLYDFINANYRDIYSILDIKKEKGFIEYYNFLIESNVNVLDKVKKYYAKEMGKKETTRYSSDVLIFNSLYALVNETVNEGNKSERDKDIWDIRKLGIKISDTRPEYTLNFTKISQPEFRSTAKKYIEFRLKSNKTATVKADLRSLNLLSEFLFNQYPNKELKDINRDMIEEFIGFARIKLPNKINSIISNVNIFLETGLLYGWKVPQKQLIVSLDFSKNKRKNDIIYYSDNELHSINNNLDKLPLHISRMVFVMETLGLRVSDVCTLLPRNLQESSNGYKLDYYQNKTGKRNTVPVNDELAIVLKSEITRSKELYGEDCKYIFAKSNTECIKAQQCSRVLLEWAINNNILDDNGNVLKIMTHSFRRTFATEYARLGLDPNVIRLLLGQNSLNTTLRHYIAIHSEDMVTMMKPITDADNQLIRNIGNIQQVITDVEENEETVPLPNGCCTRNVTLGLCDHANLCYGCVMFKAHKKYLYLYRYHLQKAEENIKMCEINGFERLLQINTDLKKNIMKIIKKIT